MKFIENYAKHFFDSLMTIKVLLYTPDALSEDVKCEIILRSGLQPETAFNSVYLDYVINTYTFDSLHNRQLKSLRPCKIFVRRKHSSYARFWKFYRKHPHLVDAPNDVIVDMYSKCRQWAKRRIGMMLLEREEPLTINRSIAQNIPIRDLIKLIDANKVVFESDYSESEGVSLPNLHELIEIPFSYPDE
jgi:hypothetical protein